MTQTKQSTQDPTTTTTTIQVPPIDISLARPLSNPAQRDSATISFNHHPKKDNEPQPNLEYRNEQEFQVAVEALLPDEFHETLFQ